MLTGLVSRLIIIAICGVFGVGIGWGISYVQGIPIRAGQETAKQILGDKASLCADATLLQKVRTSRVTLDGKIAVIHVQDGTLYQPYQDALKADRQAKQASEVAGILCLVDSESVYDVDKYGANATYTCTRYEHDFDAYLLDASTGKVVAYRNIEGPEPAPCPARTDRSLTRHGEPPSPQDVADWIN